MQADYSPLRGSWLAWFLLSLLCPACATLTPEDVDPLEKINRPIYTFNQQIDKFILKPAADAYVKVIPQPVRSVVSNFFDNVAYLNVIANDFLQGKGEQGLSDIARFIFNSTFGIFGFFDVATPMGLRAHQEDFGQTLGVWGVKPGPYLVLPLFGPSTLRDSPGLAVSAATNLLFYAPNSTLSVPLGVATVPLGSVTVSMGVLGAVDARARASGGYEFINETALDPYAFTREAYLQRRTYLIYDGKPPLLELSD